MPLFLLLGFLALLPLHADVTGSVTLKGQPKSQDVSFLAQASGCGESPVRHTENWKIGPKGELADVVVWIVDPKYPDKAGLALPPEVVLKQIGCRYDPHVIVVTATIPFKIVNADPTLHNIRARVYNGPDQPLGDTVFNFGQSYQGQTDERQFDQPGIYALQCDVHNWMQCWVMVLPQAGLVPSGVAPYSCFAVTGTDGSFKLQLSDRLPDGDYKIDAWHPRFSQPLEQTIHVKNGTANVNFQFDGAKSF
jgi:plastocyanin